jgi:hypothetical protein
MNYIGRVANEPNEVAFVFFSGVISDIRGTAIIAKQIDVTNRQTSTSKAEKYLSELQDLVAK